MGRSGKEVRPAAKGERPAAKVVGRVGTAVSRDTWLRTAGEDPKVEVSRVKPVAKEVVGTASLGARPEVKVQEER